MIYDQRTYVCRAGTVARHIALYLERGFPVQTRHLGRPLLYAVTEVGDVNSYVHVWAYESLADMERRRAAMRADPAWQDYLAASRAAGHLLRQETRLLRSVDLPAV